MQSDVHSYLILIYYIATPDEMYTECTGSCKSNYLGELTDKLFATSSVTSLNIKVLK